MMPCCAHKCGNAQCQRCQDAKTYAQPVISQGHSWPHDNHDTKKPRDQSEISQSIKAVLQKQATDQGHLQGHGGTDDRRKRSIDPLDGNEIRTKVDGILKKPEYQDCPPLPSRRRKWLAEHPGQPDRDYA